MKIFTTDFQGKYQEHSSSLIKKAVGGWTCGGSSDCNGRCVGRSYAPRREGYFPTEMTAVLSVPCNGKFVTRRVLKSKKIANRVVVVHFRRL